MCAKAAALTYRTVIWEKQVAPPAAPVGATDTGHAGESTEAAQQ